MIQRFSQAKIMSRRRYANLLHEGMYVAEVDVELIETADSWCPYLSLDDSCKLDDVRLALRRADVKRAARLARVYTPTPVAV